MKRGRVEMRGLWRASNEERSQKTSAHTATVIGGGGLGWIWVEKKEEEEIHKARGKMKEREEKQRK